MEIFFLKVNYISLSRDSTVFWPLPFSVWSIVASQDHLPLLVHKMKFLVSHALMSMLLTLALTRYVLSI